MKKLFAVALLVLVSSPLHAQIVRTIAGTPGVAGAQDGPASEATFWRPTWLDFDPAANAIFVVDRANQTIRRIGDGRVSTVRVAGSAWDENAGVHEFRFGGPAGGGIAVEPYLAGCGFGSYAYGMFVASTADNMVVMVSNMNGTKPMYANRDDVSPVVAGFAQPGDVALSWDYNGHHQPRSQVYIADVGTHTIRRIQMSESFEGCPQPRIFGTYAGIAGFPGHEDGNLTSARFRAPRGVATAPDGSVYVADTDNHTIRRITPEGQVITVAGRAGTPGHADGVASNALLRSPMGIDVNDLGEVFIADTGNHVIRKLTLDGRLITIAGAPGKAGFADGAAMNARFSAPVGIRLVGRDRLLIADTSNEVIREYDASQLPRRRAVR